MEYDKSGFIFLVGSLVLVTLLFLFILVQKPISIDQIASKEGDSLVSSVASIDPQTLWQSSEAIIALGKKTYDVNCTLCHGSSGKGDGPAGKSLVPPPRDMTSLSGWKKGSDRINLFKTLYSGLEGTSMAAFAHLPIQERWALVHYVRTLSGGGKEDSDDKVKTFFDTWSE